MKNSSQSKGRALIVIGLCAFATVGLALHMQLEMAAGIGFGIGVTTILFGLGKLKSAQQP
jgi:hypothetical protein